MAYVALQAADAGALPRLALLAAGAATVSYNGRNYLRARASEASDSTGPLGA
jgi:hypothetical protein